MNARSYDAPARLAPLPGTPMLNPLPTSMPLPNGDPSQTPRRTLRGLELRCPPLPQTLVEALDLIDKPAQMEVGPVTEMVQRDPIVVARLLHTVNSAYYGLRHTISSAERAVVLLGPVAVAGIVVGMHMLKLRSILESPAGASFHRLIRHSIATAFLTRHLVEGTPRDRSASRNRPARIGVSFTAGLLHDFGKIILVYNFSEEAVALYDQETIGQHVAAPDEREMEQLLFGCDHAEAGEYAARKLNFPDLLTDIIRLHHEPERPSGNADTDRLVRATAAANLASKAMGYAFTKASSWEQCADDPIWSLVAQHEPYRYPTPEAVIADLQTQQEHLDQYVEQLMESSQAAFQNPNIFASQSRMLKKRFP